MIHKSYAYPVAGSHEPTDQADRQSLIAGMSLAASLTLLICVPVLQTAFVGSLSRIVPAAILILAIFTVANRKMHSVWQPAMLLVVYAVVCAGSTLSAPDVGGARQLLLHLAIGGSTFVMGLSCAAGDRMLVVRTVIVLAVMESLYGVGEAIGFLGPIWGYARLDPNGLASPYVSEIFLGAVRGQGSLGHPLLLAFVSVIGIGLLIGMRPFRSFFLQVTLICIMYAGTFAASSRSGIALATLLILFSARAAWFRIVLGGWMGALSLIFLTSFDFWSSPVVERFQSSNSLANRVSSVSAVQPLLTEQNTMQVLFGNGLWSTKRLYQTGILPYKGGFYAIDNQLVSTLASCGLIALVSILGAIVWSLWHGGREYRWGLLGGFLMFWTFEVLIWPTSLGLTLAIIGMALGAGSQTGFGGSQRQIRAKMSVPSARISLGRGRF